MDWDDEQREAIAACCRQLVAEGWIEPLAPDAAETRRWDVLELASLWERHFHELLDVTTLSEEQRLSHERRVSFSGQPLANPHGDYRQPYWLLDGDRRVGTIAIATMLLGSDLVSISSLYVVPAERRRQIGRRALASVFRAAVANGAGGIRLETSWTWQPAVRFYASIGMWVWMWKHDLVFKRRPELPAYRVELAERRASFLIEQAGEWHPMVHAQHRGERLGWEPCTRFDALGEESFELLHCIPGTFAVHLALAGWPLIRSDETWAKRYDWSDAGYPEGLAYRIGLFENADRQHGFDVRTPRIPGLPRCPRELLGGQECD